MEERLYTVKEAAQLLGVGKNRAYDLIHAGLLPVLKIGGYKIRASAIRKFSEDYEGYDLTDPYHPKKIDLSDFPRPEYA